jgi:hypothetical protein
VINSAKNLYVLVQSFFLSVIEITDRICQLYSNSAYFYKILFKKLTKRVLINLTFTIMHPVSLHLAGFALHPYNFCNASLLCGCLNLSHGIVRFTQHSGVFFC